MKKTIIAALLLVISVVIGTLCYVNSFYPLGVEIIEVDEQDDVVVCIDGAGNAWEFSGVEDWQVGDFAALLMNNHGTAKTIYDDVIVAARYAGTFEG